MLCQYPTREIAAAAFYSYLNAVDIQDWQDIPVCGICRIRRICRNCSIFQFVGFARSVGSAGLAGSSSLRDLIVRLSGRLVWDVDDQREFDLTRVLIRLQRHWLEGIDKNARIYLLSQRNGIIIILENACVLPDPIDLSSLEMSCNQAKESFVLRIQ